MARRETNFGYLPYRNISLPLAITIFCRRRIGLPSVKRYTIAVITFRLGLSNAFAAIRFGLGPPTRHHFGVSSLPGIRLATSIGTRGQAGIRGRPISGKVGVRAGREFRSGQWGRPNGPPCVFWR